MKIIINKGSIFQWEAKSWKYLAIHLLKTLKFTYEVQK